MMTCRPCGASFRLRGTTACSSCGSEDLLNWREERDRKERAAERRERREREAREARETACRAEALMLQWRQERARRQRKAVLARERRELRAWRDRMIAFIVQQGAAQGMARGYWRGHAAEKHPGYRRSC